MDVKERKEELLHLWWEETSDEETQGTSDLIQENYFQKAKKEI